MRRPVPPPPPPSQVVCGVAGGSHGQGPGVGSRAQHVGQGDGEGEAGLQCHGSEGPGLCLLERLTHHGPGARAAALRREVTMGLEERRRRERQ